MVVPLPLTHCIINGGRNQCDTSSGFYSALKLLIVAKLSAYCDEPRIRDRIDVHDECSGEALRRSFEKPHSHLKLPEHTRQVGAVVG